MNFKIIFYLSIFTILVSCGLKNRPKASSDSKLPSIENKYSVKIFKNKEKKQEDEEKKKRK